MSANLEVKKQVVEDIKARIQAAKSVVFIDYKGLTVAEDTDFRSEFRKADCEYKVLKNTLVRKALNDLGVPISMPTLTAQQPLLSVRMKQALQRLFVKLAKSSTIKSL